MQALIGLGASTVGSAASSRAQKEADELNRAQTEQANQASYQKWLMSRGVGVNGAPVNTKYPLWMGMNSAAPQQRTIVKRGEGTPNYGNSMGSAATITDVPVWAYPDSTYNPKTYGESMVAPLSNNYYLVGDKDYNPFNLRQVYSKIGKEDSLHDKWKTASGAALAQANDPIGFVKNIGHMF